MSAKIQEPKSSEAKADKTCQQLKILLVEDNPDDAELTRRLLRRICLDRDIFLAADAEEALSCLVSEHIQKSYDLGAVTYLLKPISEDELLMTLSYLT